MDAIRHGERLSLTLVSSSERYILLSSRSSSFSLQTTTRVMHSGATAVFPRVETRRCQVPRQSRGTNGAKTNKENEKTEKKKKKKKKIEAPTFSARGRNRSRANGLSVTVTGSGERTSTPRELIRRCVVTIISLYLSTTNNTEEAGIHEIAKKKLCPKRRSAPKTHRCILFIRRSYVYALGCISPNLQLWRRVEFRRAGNTVYFVDNNRYIVVGAALKKCINYRYRDLSMSRSGGGRGRGWGWGVSDNSAKTAKTVRTRSGSPRKDEPFTGTAVYGFTERYRGHTATV